MKKSILFILPALLFAVASCEPLKDDVQLGGVLDPSDIVISVVGKTSGSNDVVFHNDTPGVTGQWLDGKRIIASGDRIPHILRTIGENEVTFIAFCDGGTVTKSIVYNVERLDVEPPPLELTAWQGSLSVDAGQQYFGGEIFGDVEPGDMLRVYIENKGVGWGQIHYGNWSGQLIEIPGGFAGDMMPELAVTDEIATKLKEVGIVAQGAGWSVVKIGIGK